MSDQRKFYEDDEDVYPLPGTVTPAAGSEIASLGPNRIIDGISVRSPTGVESVFRSARESVYGVYTQAQSYLNQGYSKYNQTEREVTTTVSNLHSKGEDLLPNSIYIVIATLSGNIAARQRGVFARVAFPVVLGLASFKYFLPQTFDNTKNFAWSIEQQKLPQIARQQERVYHTADGWVKSIEQTSESGKKSVQSGVQLLRKSIADVTGLNLDEEVSKK